MNWLCLALGALSGIMFSHIFIIFFRGINNIIMTPGDIQYCTNLNTFGQWLVYIIVAVSSPIIFIFKMIYLLMHIGRRRGSYRSYTTPDYNKKVDSESLFEDINNF